MKEFKTKNDDLTPYALACGYIQKRSDSVQHLQIDLSHNGNNYDVRACDLQNSYRRVFWLTTDSLAVARKIFKAKRWRVAWAKLSDKQKYVCGLMDYETGYDSTL